MQLFVADNFYIGQYGSEDPAVETASIQAKPGWCAG